MTYVLIYKEYERPIECRRSRRGRNKKKKQVLPNYFCRSMREEKLFTRYDRRISEKHSLLITCPTSLQLDTIVLNSLLPV